MSFDDRIGCAPQLVTACIALAAAIAGSVYMRTQNKTQPIQKTPHNMESLATPLVPPQQIFRNSGAER